jgi:hypothetical protein
MKARKEKLIKITLENENFLKRLQQRTSAYSVDRWAKDYKKHEGHKRLNRKQPYVFGQN